MNLRFVFLTLFLQVFVLGLQGAGFPNIDRPAAGALLTPGRIATTDGRMAIIAWHNGLIYTVPESPGSLPGSDLQVRSWDIADPTAPVELETFGVTHHPVMAHGYFYHNNQMILGNNFPEPMSFTATDTYGVNLNEPFAELDPVGGVGGHGSMYHPFNVDPSFGSYFFNPVDTHIRRYNEALGIWETHADLDHIGMTGVIGHAFVVGNLLFFASDHSRTGLAIYDISDLSTPVLLSTITEGGAGGYWPSIWGGDGRLYVVWPYRQEFNEAGNGFRMIDVTDPTDPQWVIDAALPDEDQTMYVNFQDEFAFMGNHKVDLRSHEIVLTMPTEANDIDASQFSLPLGNLVLTGGYGNQQGMAIWVHQAEADTRPPEVGFHIPQDGQTHYPVTAPISLLIHETLETRTIINGDTILIRPAGGDPLPAQFSRSFDGVLTFTPDAPLDPNTTYEVVLDGIEDAAGNAMEPYSFTFSTGDTVLGNAAPLIDSFTADIAVVEPGATITLTASASDDPAQTLEYRFDPGDGRPKTAWGSAPQIALEYAEPGHYLPVVQVRDDLGAVASRNLGINVFSIPTGPFATASSTLAVDEAHRRVWTVNPDADSVTVIDADTLLLIAEVPVGADPRAIALDAAGNAWITCHDDDRVLVLDGDTRLLLADLSTGYGSAPFGVVISPDDAVAYVSLYGDGAVQRFDVATRNPLGDPLPLGPTARALAVSADHTRLLVTRFISPKDHAEVWEIDASTFTVARTLRLPKFGGATHRDGTANSRGVANYLAAIAYSPDGQTAWLAATKQNTERGELFNAAQTHDTVQRNLLLQIDLDPALPQGAIARDIDLDNSDSASALAYSPHLDFLFVALQGNNQVAVFDLLVDPNVSGLGSLVTRQSVGAAPQGIATDSITGRVFVQNFLDRNLSVLEATDLFNTGSLILGTTEVDTVAVEPLTPEVLAGKRIFYHADERMSAEGYISCASCHIDGGSDGRVWDFTQRGEGLRNTTDLRGRSGIGHGRVHWSGNFDEIQDFENDIRLAFGGTGFLTDEEFALTENPLGTPKAGLNPDLDALAAYVDSLGNETIPRSPHRQDNGALTSAAEAGRQVFSAMNCVACHTSHDLTDSSLDQLHNVGTLRETSGQRLGAPLTGIDTPTLRGLWSNAPYFHDGSALTLESVFIIAGGDLYQGESATSIPGGNIQLPTGGNLVVNFDNTSMGGHAQIDLGGEATYENIDGGSGGIGAIELRYSSSGPGNVVVSVNGVDHLLPLVATGNQPSFRTTYWQTARLEGIELLPGPGNTIVFSGFPGRLGIDHFTISTSDDLALADPHRAVPAEFRQDLVEYLLSLDGSPVEVDTPDSPLVVITPAPGQGNPVRYPFVDFDIGFSSPVTGFDDTDLIVAGNAGATWAVLYPSDDDQHFRARVGGFSGDGTVSLRLDIGAGQAGAYGSRAVLPVVVAYESAVVEVDPLAAINDEFHDDASLAGWQRLHETEGWNADKLEHWTIDTARPGHMRLTPVASSWYQDNAGPFVYREISGDFVATVELEVSRRDGLPGRPSSNYSYGGLMIRALRPFTNAGANPGSDWVAGTENRIALNFGTANPVAQPNPDLWEVIVSDTTNSGGTFYSSTQAVPVGENRVTLQMVRIGSAILLLRRHPGGDWIVESQFDRPDLPDTVQIGIVTAADYNAVAGLTAFEHNRTISAAGSPDVVVDVDWFRISTADPALSGGDLLGLATTGPFGPIQTSDAPSLGDAPAALPEIVDGETYQAWLTLNRTADELADPNFTDPDGDPNRNGVTNLLHFALGHDASPPLTMQMLAPDTVELQFIRNSEAREVTLHLESSEDLVVWNPIASSAEGTEPTGSASILESEDPLPEVTVETSTPSDRNFFRLRAVLD